MSARRPRTFRRRLAVRAERLVLGLLMRAAAFLFERRVVRTRKR